MPLIAWVVVVILAMIMIAVALQSTPKQEKPTAQKFEVTTSEIGRDIPVLFGTRYLKSGNIVWWGDTRTVPIKVKTGK